MEMNNLVENQFGHGGIWTPKDESVPLMKEVAMDTAPFDWNVGFSVPDTYTKDQGSSSSCGGQAASYKMGAVFQGQKSAKFVYAPIAAPGGGSTEPSISNLLQHVGDCEESICPSTQPGFITEAFMTRKGDISQLAYSDALKSIVGARVYVQRSLDSIAQAVRDHQGIIIGIYGENNGTWLSKFPKPPKEAPNGTMWAHFLFVAGVEMIDGVKYMKVHNSWGDSVGEKGYQYLDATYIPYIWTSFTYVDTAIQPTFSHHFTTAMGLGDSGPEVVALQQALKVDGEFPSTQSCTGYYGAITKKAVDAFQVKYFDDILLPARSSGPTGRVGQFTLAKLNSLFNR